MMESLCFNFIFFVSENQLSIVKKKKIIIIWNISCKFSLFDDKSYFTCYIIQRYDYLLKFKKHWVVILIYSVYD